MRDAGPVFRVSRDSLTLELERFLSTDRRSVPWVLPGIEI